MNGNIASTKRKYSNSSIPENKHATKVYSDRLSVIHGLGKPIPDWFIEEIRIDLEEWYKKKTSLRFKDFLLEKKLPWKVFCDLRDRYEPLQQEYEWCMYAIASRRELGAMTRRLDPCALRMMPHYDPDWTENEEKLAKIKRLSQQEQSHGQTIIAVIPEVPHSNLVPERNDNDR